MLGSSYVIASDQPGATTSPELPSLLPDILQPRPRRLHNPRSPNHSGLPATPPNNLRLQHAAAHKQIQRDARIVLPGTPSASSSVEAVSIRFAMASNSALPAPRTWVSTAADSIP